MFGTMQSWAATHYPLLVFTKISELDAIDEFAEISRINADVIGYIFVRDQLQDMGAALE